MSRIVFLLEEYSMRVLLEGLVPRFFPGVQFICVPHEGKQDLEKSIPRKLRAWREPGVRFVVLRDNDGGDCHSLKTQLSTLCSTGGKSDSLVRIACQELEAWYFGDTPALARAFGDKRLMNISQKRRYRNPDTITQPAMALEQLIPSFQKVSGARQMAPLMARSGNRSHSFRVLIDGVARLVLEMPQVSTDNLLDQAGETA